MRNAYEDLRNELDADEAVEAVVFGEWGWGGYSEPDPAPVPGNIQGVVLTLDEAMPYFEGWSFDGGFGAPECYATYIWTNRRVLWVTQYDGATSLESAPRHPVACNPDMPGG
jgi:hypothetical protein